MDVKVEQAEVKTGKTGERPSQLEILDVKKYPSLYGRLFIESVTGEDMMDPELELTNLSFIASPRFAIDQGNYSYNRIFEELSIEERKEQWKGVGFNDAYAQWQTKFTDFMKNITDQKRIEALKVIVGKEPSAFTAEDADTLFEAFSHDKTDVTSFAKTVVANLVREGKVDPANLKALLPHIEWIASGIFGEKTAGIVSRVIEIEAQLRNNTDDFIIYLGKASPGKPELGSEERSILATLHTSRKGEKKQDRQRPDQQPPVQPKDDKDQVVPEAIPDLDVARLKAIYERCVAKYEGQNPNGLLDINVVLDKADRAHVRKLIEIAKSTHAKLTDGNSDWTKFVQLRDEMRAVHGTFGESGRVIKDNSIQAPTKGQEGNIPVIKVPANILRLSVWESEIGLLEFAFDKYDKGNSRGVMAAYLGNAIKDVQEFVKASQSSDNKDIPPGPVEPQENLRGEKPPAPLAKQAESADKKPDTSQEKQENTIKIVMTENDKGEAQFKLIVNGEEIPIEGKLFPIPSLDEEEFAYLEVPSGITANFMVRFPNQGLDVIKIVGGQGVKLNLKTLSEALNDSALRFIHLGSVKSEFRDEDLSKREGQVLWIHRSKKYLSEILREWIALEDLDTHLASVATLNEARKTLDETEPSQSSSEARENIVTLEGKGDLVEELNEKLRQNRSSDNVTFGVSPDILKTYLTSITKGGVQGGTVEINKTANQIAIKGVTINIPVIGGTATFDLLIDNGQDGITANIQNYGGGFRADRARGEIEERVKDINSAIKKRLDEEIFREPYAVLAEWETKKISILDGQVLIEFDRTHYWKRRHRL